MGYAGLMRFAPDELALLADTEEIEIETARPDGQTRRTIIWIMVDGDDAFIRSVNGTGARWYREATANPSVTIHAGTKALPANLIAAPDPESVARVNGALERKYTGIVGLREMLVPDTFETTLRVEPA
jgi:hypothetical protein